MITYLISQSLMVCFIGCTLHSIILQEFRQAVGKIKLHINQSWLIFDTINKNISVKNHDQKYIILIFLTRTGVVTLCNQISGYCLCNIVLSFLYFIDVESSAYIYCLFCALNFSLPQWLILKQCMYMWIFDMCF